MPPIAIPLKPFSPFVYTTIKMTAINKAEAATSTPYQCPNCTRRNAAVGQDSVIFDSLHYKNSNHLMQSNALM